MTTYDRIREGSHGGPRFFEDLSKEEKESFTRSLRRNEGLRRTAESTEHFLRYLLRSPLGVRLGVLQGNIFMFAASICGVMLYRLSGGKPLSQFCFVGHRSCS